MRMDSSTAGGTGPVKVDLWLWHYEPSDTGVLADLLSQQERDRAAKFINPQHAARYIFAHARIRQALAPFCGIMAQELVFETGAYGKPGIAHGPQFNLSHSGDMVALAVCPDRPIGVDIERHRPFDPGIVTRFFSEREQRALSGLTGKDLENAFFRVWTRKEAIIKALGFGLSMPLDRFDVSAEPQARILRIDPTYGAAADWDLVDFDPAYAFRGALAVEARGQALDITVRAGAVQL